MKKRLAALGLLMFLSFAILGTLILFNEYKSHTKNAFFRDLPPLQIEALEVADLKFKDAYIAGLDDNNIYVGSRHYKNLLYLLTKTTLKSRKIILDAPPGYHPAEDTQLMVDSTRVLLADGKRAQLGRGTTKNLKIEKIFNTPYYSICSPLSDNSYIFKSVDTNMRNVLVKELSGKFFVFNDFMKEQIDGFFCTDGELLTVPATNKVIYVYYYRNQFIVADTNLHKRYLGRTIDTVSHAQIKVAKIKSNGQTTLSAPPLFVNRHATANNSYLFIQSALKADNETEAVHESSSPIDVYSLREGRYISSFYLPDFNKHKLTDFKVHGDLLVALFGNYLYTFRLHIGNTNKGR